MLQHQPLCFEDKDYNLLAGLGGLSGLFVPKMLNCPHCAVASDFSRQSSYSVEYEESLYFLVVHWKCTNCKKKHVQYYDVDFVNKISKFIASYPGVNIKVASDAFKELSPRFYDYLSQALFADYHNHQDLAAMGFRSALEILCKDFVIKEMGVAQEKVENMHLQVLIDTHFPEVKLKNTAHLVRMLGNDYTHYVKRYSTEEYQTLKIAFEYFTALLEMQYFAAHPPTLQKQNS